MPPTTAPFSLLLLKRRAPTGWKGIRRRTFPGEWITCSEPTINLEGSKVGPRPGFDSCPRVMESGTTGDAPIQGQGLSHSLEVPQMYSRPEERSTVESPRREASSPRTLSHGTKVRTTTLWHFWRAPPWPLADSYQMEHGPPLEFPANSSLEIVETRSTRVVRRSPPLLLS
jgi:hypothetical protein